MRIIAVSFAVLLACSGDDSTTADGGDDAASGSDVARGGDAAKDSATESGPVLCNGVVCGANEVCFNATSCACAAGFVPNGASGCIAAPAGSPASHSSADVCARWKAAHVITTANPFTAGSTRATPERSQPAA